MFILHGPPVQTVYKQEPIHQAHQVARAHPPADSLQRSCVMGKIGDQIWTLTNLDVATYRNGDAIPQVQDVIAWSNLTTGA